MTEEEMMTEYAKKIADNESKVIADGTWEKQDD